MQAAAVVPPPRILVEAPIAAPRWRRSALRGVRADDHGLWHFRLHNGTGLQLRPTRIDLGPGGFWLSLAGPVDAFSPERHGPGAPPASRWTRLFRQAHLRRVTLWAIDVEREDWRRLRIAALWRTHWADLPHE